MTEVHNPFLQTDQLLPERVYAPLAGSILVDGRGGSVCRRDFDILSIESVRCGIMT